MPNFLSVLFRPTLTESAQSTTPAGAPIQTSSELNDNGLIIEAVFQQFADLVGVELSTLKSYTSFTPLRLFSHVRDLVKRTEQLSDLDGVNYLRPSQGLDEDVQMLAWLEMPVLPKFFRRDLANHVMKVDNLEGHVANMSQTRWERLREWAVQNG